MRSKIEDAKDLHRSQTVRHPVSELGRLVVAVGVQIPDHQSTVRGHLRSARPQQLATRFPNEKRVVFLLPVHSLVTHERLSSEVPFSDTAILPNPDNNIVGSKEFLSAKKALGSNTITEIHTIQLQARG